MKLSAYLLHVLIVSFLCSSCQSSSKTDEGATNGTDSLENYQDVILVDQNQKEPIIPDVVFNYLGDFHFPDSLLLDTAKDCSNVDCIQEARLEVKAKIQLYKQQVPSLPDIAESNLSTVNNILYEYLLYKFLRDKQQDLDIRYWAMTKILIRGGNTTIHPSYLIEIMDKFSDEIKNGNEWKQKRKLLEPKQLVGTSIFNAPNSRVYKRDLTGPTDFHNLLKTNKKTIMVFTASWCAPCKTDYERHKTKFQELEHQGVDIISYSVDHKIEDWKRLLQSPDYLQFCVLDEKGFKSSLTEYLGINAVPMYLSIDEKGIIEGIYSSNNILKMFDKFMK